jgi:hypothetical protein
VLVSYGRVHVCVFVCLCMCVWDVSYGIFSLIF